MEQIEFFYGGRVRVEYAGEMCRLMYSTSDIVIIIRTVKTSDLSKTLEEIKDSLGLSLDDIFKAHSHK
jgi:hypothetical protein